MDQERYDRRIKDLEKKYEAQVYISVDKCKDKIFERAKRELRDEQRETKERSNKRVVHTTGDRDFLG